MPASQLVASPFLPADEPAVEHQNMATAPERAIRPAMPSSAGTLSAFPHTLRNSPDGRRSPV
jgi:hypothetical protein